MSRVIDSLVMLVGAFIIGWHLVPAGAVKARPAPEVRTEIPVETVPDAAPAPATRAECPDDVATAYVPPPPPPRAEADPDALPEAYRDIIGPLASNGT